MAIVTYTPEERAELIEEALSLRYNNRKNWEEISKELSIARSTLGQWRKTQDWKDSELRWRRSLREQIRGDSANMMDEALDTLYQLMRTDKSGYVRYMCATKILDINQVGNEIEESQADQKKELGDFLIKLEKNKLKSANELAKLTVNGGGMLPDTIQAMNEEYRLRKVREAQAIEAEFRSLDEDEILENEEEDLPEEEFLP